MSSNFEYLDDAQLKSMFPNGSNPDENVVIVDIRSTGEYAAEYIAGSVNLPLDELLTQDKNQFKEKVVVFHCKGGVRTKNNQHILEMFATKKSYSMAGGIEQWKSCNQPVKTS